MQARPAHPALTDGQLIKQLSATPTLLAQNASSPAVDPQVSLQANRATFFFHLVRLLAEHRSCLDALMWFPRSENWRRSMLFTFRRRPRCVDASERARPSHTQYSSSSG